MTPIPKGFFIVLGILTLASFALWRPPLFQYGPNLGSMDCLPLQSVR